MLTAIVMLLSSVNAFQLRLTVPSGRHHLRLSRFMSVSSLSASVTFLTDALILQGKEIYLQFAEIKFRILELISHLLLIYKNST